MAWAEALGAALPMAPASVLASVAVNLVLFGPCSAELDIRIAPFQPSSQDSRPG